jgi:hypothetical protein
LVVSDLLRIRNYQPTTTNYQPAGLARRNSFYASAAGNVRQNPPPYEYRRPGLALDPFFEDQTTTKALQLLELALGDGRIERLGALFGRAARAHGDEALAQLAAVLDEDARQERLARLRQVVHGADARFVLAVLRNAPGREAALALLGERFADPFGAVTRLADELAGHGVDEPELLEPLLGG